MVNLKSSGRKVSGVYRAGRKVGPQCGALSQANTTFFGCELRSHGLPMRRSGTYGRCSSRGDQSQAACCGEQFCAGEITADGFTRNTWRALKRLNIVDG